MKFLIILNVLFCVLLISSLGAMINSGMVSVDLSGVTDRYIAMASLIFAALCALYAYISVKVMRKNDMVSRLNNLESSLADAVRTTFCENNRGALERQVRSCVVNHDNMERNISKVSNIVNDTSKVQVQSVEITCCLLQITVEAQKLLKENMRSPNKILPNAKLFEIHLDALHAIYSLVSKDDNVVFSSLGLLQQFVEKNAVPTSILRLFGLLPDFNGTDDQSQPLIKTIKTKLSHPCT